MKNFILILFFCILSGSSAFAQYIVTKVSGRIKNSAGSYIKPGTQLKNDEKLTWGTMQDKLYVVIIGKGEKILSPSPSATPDNNAYSELILSALHQSSRAGSLSGRGEIIEHIPDALQTYASSNGKVVIEDENKFLFDASAYPQTNGNTFFVQIDAPLKSPVIRRLKTQNDTLYINYADLATDSFDPNAKYSLGYSDKSAGKSNLIVAFLPYFDRTSEMETLIAATITAYPNNNQTDDLRDSVYRNVYASSGKPNGILFMQLFNKYLKNNGVIEAKNADGQGSGGDYNEEAFNSVPQLSQSVEVTRADLPANFSLLQYAPPAGNQGYYSSCTAWSTAYAARTIMYAVKHGYTRTNHYDLLLANTFAPDFIYNNIRLTADCTQGTYIPSALKFMQNSGNILRVGNTFECGKTYPATETTSASKYTIKTYTRVNNPGMSNQAIISRIKSYITDKHPLPFGFKLPSSFSGVGLSGIWQPEPEELATVKANPRAYSGHAMCLIGYDDNINGGSFEIMNSWGPLARRGFYWINYNDFCTFLNEIYAIEDNDDSNDIPVVTVPKIAQQVEIKPVVEPGKILPPVKTTPIIEKPSLKGEMTFMQLGTDGNLTLVAVNKKAVDTRGQTVEADNSKPVYANFVLSQPFYSRGKYKIKFGIEQAAYVYIIGVDKSSIYTLFPQKKRNESALINITGSTLYLPDQKSSYTLDDVTGKEKMCVLVSKSPVDIDAIISKATADGNNLYANVRGTLGTRLIEVKTSRYSNDKISFNTEVGNTDVLAFFVEMDHL